MILVAIYQIAEQLLNIALLLAFPMTVLGTIACWSKGIISVSAWTLFYGYGIFALGAMGWHWTRHIMTLDAPAIKYARRGTHHASRSTMVNSDSDVSMAFESHLPQSEPQFGADRRQPFIPAED